MPNKRQRLIAAQQVADNLNAKLRGGWSPLHEMDDCRLYTPLATLREKFMSAKSAEGCRPTTLTQYRSVTDIWLRWCEDNGHADRYSGTYLRPLAIRYMDDILEKRQRHRSYNNTLKVMKVFFQWAVEHCYAKENPFSGIKMLKKEPKIRILDNKTFKDCLLDNEICNVEINGNNDVFGYRIGTSADNHDNLDNNYSCEVPDCPHMNSNSSIYHQNGQTKTLEQLKQQSTYDVFDFENIWMMSNLYPILQISNILLNNNLNTNEESNYTSTTIQHTITDEYSGRWNFNDYYNKYLKDTTILLSSARDNIGNYMSCAYQGYLGHIKLSGQDILDMTIKGDDGYLVNSEYRAIQEKYNTKDTLEDLILNPNDDFYTIAYNLVPRTEYKDWLESFKNTYDVASNNEGDYYMLDFDRRLGTVFESPFPNVITRSDYLTPNSVVTTDVVDYGYNSIDPSYWINKISKVEHINPLGSFNNLIYHLNHDTDVLHYDIYFSEGNKPPTWQELKYVFYIPSRVYYNNEHNLTKKDFFDIIMSNGCYFRGLAVMFAYCSLINGLEYYDSNPNLQFPYAPYYSDFKLGELIDEYLYNNNTTFKHYKL